MPTDNLNIENNAPEVDQSELDQAAREQHAENDGQITTAPKVEVTPTLPGLNVPKPQLQQPLTGVKLPDDPKAADYNEIRDTQGVINALKAEQARLAEKEETEEDRIKREKREKSQRIVSAVGDGLRALGNLYFTTKYAPNMYNHEKDSQFNDITAWQDKMKKEREDNHAAYINYAMKIGDLQAQQDKVARELRQRAEDVRYRNEKLAQDQRNQDWKEQFYENKQYESAQNAQGRLDETTRHNKRQEEIAANRGSSKGSGGGGGKSTSRKKGSGGGDLTRSGRQANKKGSGQTSEI